jgi:hypothetical protein
MPSRVAGTTRPPAISTVMPAPRNRYQKLCSSGLNFHCAKASRRSARRPTTPVIEVRTEIDERGAEEHVVGVGGFFDPDLG